ncbi:MAG: lipocalin family protein [Chitinophagaceae bacterium]|nr:lipocalin family protein [Chitinophagaceae bacterium]
MKIKYFTICIGLIIASVFLSSCSVSKDAKGMKKSINGNWTLQSITTEGASVEGVDIKMKASIFNEADYNCFIGSSWSFIANNSTGSYTIANGGNCVGVTRNIKWSIYEPAGGEKSFQFKRLENKRTAMDDNNGFRLRITTLEDNVMQLKSDNNFEGRTVTLVYNFVRN